MWNLENDFILIPRVLSVYPDRRLGAAYWSLEMGESKHALRSGFPWFVFHSFDGWADISYILATELHQKLPVETQADTPPAPRILLLSAANWKSNREEEYQQ